MPFSMIKGTFGRGSDLQDLLVVRTGAIALESLIAQENHRVAEPRLVTIAIKMIMIPIVLLALLPLAAASGVLTTSATIDFESVDMGLFTDGAPMSVVIDGYRFFRNPLIHFDAWTVEQMPGNKVICDAHMDNNINSEVSFMSEDESPFFFDSLEYGSNVDMPTEDGGIVVMAKYPNGNIAGSTEIIRPDTTSIYTLTAAELGVVGVPLGSIQLQLFSEPGKAFFVDNIVLRKEDSSLRCPYGFTSVLNSCQYQTDEVQKWRGLAQSYCEMYAADVDPDFVPNTAPLCIAQPIPASQSYDFTIETLHPYEIGETVINLRTSPGSTCYKVWFDPLSRTASVDDKLWVFGVDLQTNEHVKIGRTPKLGQFSTYGPDEENTEFVINGQDVVKLTFKAQSTENAYGFLAYIKAGC